MLLLLLPPAAWAQTYTLGTTNLLEGPAAGSDSVVLAANSTWTAVANDAWLHLTAANQSGTTSTNVIFTFDANFGATRSGTLNIAGQTVTVTQAGSTYVAITNVTTLVSSGLNGPSGLAVDSAGNIYIGDTTNNAVKQWTVINNTVNTLVTSGLYNPYGVAVDGVGNVYIADFYNNAIEKWTASNSNFTTLVSSGLNNPSDVAVDNNGNVYITDTRNKAIKEWTVANSNVTTLVSSGLVFPYGVAVDVAGNVYIDDTSNNQVKEWTVINSNIITLVPYGPVASPRGMAVDGSGNVYIASGGNNTIKKWIAASNAVTTTASGLSYPRAVAVDLAYNVYIADTGNNTIKELPHAFVDITPKIEMAAAGNDALPIVLPASINLSGPFLPVSDASWLVVTGVTNGVVSFAFTASNTNRTGHITLVGKNISINQLGVGLGTTNLLEGPTVGGDSILLSALPANYPWTATANVNWLHLDANNQNGTGSTNLIFSFDANPGGTRTGTLTVASQTVTVTQAGSTYVAARPVITLVSPHLNNPNGVAVDSVGNVYFAESGNNAIKKWVAASNTVTTLVSSGLNNPYGVAVDGAGNVYIADTFNNAIKKWTASNSNVTTLVASGLNNPYGVAVDGVGNVYIADTFNRAVKKWTASNSNVITLVYQFPSFYVQDVAVDGTGNVFFINGFNDTVMKWTAANSNVTTLVSSGLSIPNKLAVDGSGNVYIAESANHGNMEWIAASNIVISLPSPIALLDAPNGVAVDSAGNIYYSENYTASIREIPNTFIDPTTKTEAPLASNDSLPVVLPSTFKLSRPFQPSTTFLSPWLSITGTNNAVVSFAIAANIFATNRTGYINLLGTNIAVNQAAVVPPVLNNFTTISNGTIQFAFTNNQGASFTVWTTTNMMLPFTNWTQLGTITNDGSGQYQFNDPSVTNTDQRFYRVTSP